MGPDSVGVETEARRKLGGGRRAAAVREHREQVTPGPLAEHLISGHV
jgi:hypothetical protein